MMDIRLVMDLRELLFEETPYICIVSTTSHIASIPMIINEASITKPVRIVRKGVDPFHFQYHS